MTDLIDRHDTRKKHKGYTNNELLEYLTQFYEENGRIPESRDLDNNPKYPCSGTYKKHFGRWNNALEMAGLQTNRFINVTDNELLGFLIKFFKENERSPTWEDFNNNRKYPNMKTYQRRFGSWNKALTTAGLQVNRFTELSDKELLGFLIQFYRETGKVPKIVDFDGNPKYPSFGMYTDHFGSWQKALRLVNLDVDSMARKGVAETRQQKARLAEIYVLENIEKGAKDLSGDNCNNFADGISKISKGKVYDVKSSALLIDYWMFNLDKYVDFYYLLAYDDDYKNLLHKWKIPGDFAEGSTNIGLGNNLEYNVENMKEYEIVDK